MRRIRQMAIVALTLAALLVFSADSAKAQGIIVTQPPVFYTPPPVTSYYYTPVPAVTYYQPAPVVSRYYAPPVVAYPTAPVVATPYYYPPTTVTTYRPGYVFPRRTIVTQYSYP